MSKFRSCSQVGTLPDCLYSIKKAYRRKALELHPDRHYGSVEDTTKLFAEVQAAYEVISDPQERAWYDSHRDAILRGSSEDPVDHYEHSIRMTSATDIMRLLTTFNGPMDYSDSPSGFYGLLRDSFGVLAREEEAASVWRGLEPVDYPTFGHANDTYEHVVRPFYAAWTDFATSKTFSWKDAFRYSEAPDRRVRRMMEKENKRLRDGGIREYNDAVRSMVAFVRKRDPRYTPNSQSDAERQKVLRDAATAQAARSRAANQAKLDEYVLPGWSTKQASDMSGTSESGGEAEEGRTEEHYECVACGKTFKSEKQFEVHEKSKKHMKTVRQLQKTMQNDQEVFKLDESVSGDTAPSLGKCISENDVKQQSSSERCHSPFVGHKLEIGIDLDRRSIISSSHSSNVSLTKTASLGNDLESGNDEYASRETVESRVLDSTDGSKSCSEDENESAHMTRGFGALSVENDGAVPCFKVGKAKVKRARRAVRNEVTLRDSTEVGITLFLPKE